MLLEVTYFSIHDEAHSRTQQRTVGMARDSRLSLAPTAVQIQ